MNLLREKLSEEIKKLIIHIDSEEFYDMQYSLCKDFAPDMAEYINLEANSTYSKFVAEKKTITVLDNLIEKNINKAKKLNNLFKSYYSKLQDFNFTNSFLRKSYYTIFSLLAQSIISIIMLPIAIYGLINNIFSYKIPVWITRLVKDSQFVCTFRFAIMLFTFTLFYFIQTLVFYFVFKDISITSLYFISLPITGFFSYNYFVSCKKLFSKWEFLYLKLTKNSTFTLLNEEFDKLNYELQNIFENYFKEEF